jgi:hypothetical protein
MKLPRSPAFCWLVVASLVVAGAGRAVAQAPAPPGTAPAPAAPAKSIKAVEVPFELRSGKIIIDTMVNGKGPFPFVLDTASPPTIIDSDLAKELEIKLAPMGQVGGAGEGSTPASMAEHVTLEFGGISIERPMMMAVAINRRLRGFSGMEVRGLIGNDWVTKRVVAIDYEAKKLRVYDGEGWDYKGEGTVVPTRIRSYTLVNGAVTPPGEGAEEIPVRFAIDTGAGLSAALNTPLVNRHKLLELETPMVETIVGYGLGGAVMHHVARFAKLTLGDAAIENPIVTLSQDKGGALAMTQFEGIIGFEVLSKFTVTFDGPRHRMILEKNASYARPMETDMSGMVLAGDGEGGRLRVMHLVEGMPAAAAGVKLGDVLVRLDGKAVTAEDRDRVRELLRRDGQERTLELKRGEETVTAKVRLKRAV